MPASRLGIGNGTIVDSAERVSRPTETSHAIRGATETLTCAATNKPCWTMHGGLQ